MLLINCILLHNLRLLIPCNSIVMTLSSPRSVKHVRWWDTILLHTMCHFHTFTNGVLWSVSKLIFWCCVGMWNVISELLLNPSVIRCRSRHVKFCDIWTGQYCTYAKDKDTGDMYAWGLNNYYQLGMTMLWQLQVCVFHWKDCWANKWKYMMLYTLFIIQNCSHFIKIILFNSDGTFVIGGILGQNLYILNAVRCLYVRP